MLHGGIVMDFKARAAYAWGRIKSLFTRKKPEIEVEIEEMDTPQPEECIQEPVSEAAAVSEPAEIEGTEETDSPELEVEIEEMDTPQPEECIQEPVSEAAAVPEAAEIEGTEESDSPEIEVEVYEEEPEEAQSAADAFAPPTEFVPDRTEGNEGDETLSRSAEDKDAGQEEAMPSRMTDEYKAWLKSQREAADAASSELINRDEIS